MPSKRISHWQPSVTSPAGAEADEYFKPFRGTLEGTEDTVIVRYRDGWAQSVAARSWGIRPKP